MTAFKIDENLAREAAALLRVHGFDALTVGEQKLRGTQDPQLLRVCGDEGRVLITLDMDFANIRVYRPTEHLGIIVLRPPRQDKTTVLEMLRRLLPMLDSESISQQLWIVENDRVRVWQGNE